MVYHPPVSANDIATLDPSRAAPAVIVTDGDVTAVGHGRTLPLIGSNFRSDGPTTANQRTPRMHILDVELPEKRRIYADTESDVIAALIGGDYGSLVDQVKQLENVGGPQQEELWRTVLGMRHKHADGVRIALQTEINAEAERSGSWAQLSDVERRELTRVLSPDPVEPAPVGVPTEMPIIDDSGTVQTTISGMWTAAVPLVCNSADYEPFGRCLRPVGLREEVGPDGHEYVISDEPNIIWLDVIEDVTYLTSLDAAGYLSVTVRPADQPDALWEAITAI